jgi:hypothetical protein
MKTEKIRVPNFPIRGCSLTKRQRISVVRKVMRERCAATPPFSPTTEISPQKTLDRN